MTLLIFNKSNHQKTFTHLIIIIVINKKQYNKYVNNINIVIFKNLEKKT